MAECALRRQTPKVGAECPNRARSELRGGRLATAVPTANPSRAICYRQQMHGRNGLLNWSTRVRWKPRRFSLSMTAPARKTAGQRLALQTRHSVRQGHHATRNTYFACLHDDSRQDAVLLKDVGRAPIRGRSAALKAGGDGRSCGRCSPSTIRPSRAGRSKLRWLCGHCNFEALGGSPCVFFLVPNGLLTATRARSRPHRMGEQFCIELGGPVAKHSCCTRTARMASPAQATGRCACRSPASAPPRPGAIPPGEVENAREHLRHPARSARRSRPGPGNCGSSAPGWSPSASLRYRTSADKPVSDVTHAEILAILKVLTGLWHDCSFCLRCAPACRSVQNA